MIVRGGMVVTPEGVKRADLAMEEGQITAIAPGLPEEAEEIDATGLTAFPGLIDVHVHFNEPGRATWEGAGTGSSALAAGGGTVYCDMPLNSTPCTVDGEAFQAKRKALERASYTDFGLWGGIVPGNNGKLPELAARGAIGFKAFMADSGLPEFPRSDDATLLAAMRTAARFSLPVAVHAEDNDTIAALAKSAADAGRRGIRDYLDSRPVRAEVDAIRRAAEMAGEAGAKLHIVHISSGSGVAEALAARARGVDISIETCAHYLYFTEMDMLRLGAVAKCAPPLRDKEEHQALCGALQRGEIDIVGSDHSPAPLTMKQDADFFKVWGGIAGVQSTLAVLLDQGCEAARVAAVAAANPADRFGIVNKGRLAVGNDADFTLVDLDARYTVAKGALFQRHRLSPYIGAKFRGVVRCTVVRGELIFVDGNIVGEPRGRMVATNHATTRIHA